MIEVEGFLDYTVPWELPDVYLFTGNKYITKDGRLVMGRGAAKEVRDAYAGIDKRIRICDSGVSFTFIDGRQILGWFCVKNYFGDQADIDLIKRSTETLAGFAQDRTDVSFHMNFPGIGAGWLTYEKVLPIVRILPDNVILYR